MDEDKLSSLVSLKRLPKPMCVTAESAYSMVGKALSVEADIIQQFCDFQVEWLTSHCDIELEPELEDLIIRFLHDTASCFIRERGK